MLILANFFASLLFLSTIVTLVWRKIIETQYIQEQKELVRQLAMDNYRPTSWDQMAVKSRTKRSMDEPTDSDQTSSLPPYDSFGHDTT
jgi:hypothetical protein